MTAFPRFDPYALLAEPKHRRDLATSASLAGAPAEIENDKEALGAGETGTAGKGQYREVTSSKVAKLAKAETDGAETLGTAQAVIAPVQWFEPAATAGEPPYDQPCPTRRGLIRRYSGRFEHFCLTCGSWGAFGYDVSAERPGRWFCLQHRPDGP